MNSTEPASFVCELRSAIISLGSALVDAPAFLRREFPESESRASSLESSGCLIMDSFIAMAGCIEGTSWPGSDVRMSMSRIRVFTDGWMLDPSAPFTLQLYRVQDRFIGLAARPELPADGRVLDHRAEQALAGYRVWRAGYDVAVRQRQMEARAQREAAAPPHRQVPHQPDPPSVIVAGEYAARVLDAWQSGVVATAQDNRRLADAHLIRGLVDHWLLRDPAGVRADLSHAAERMALALPEVQLHAWEYEQWQHLAVALGHRGLLDALWALRREAWDTNRIRPVNWLICRIRILDLLHQGGAEAELRGLLEMSWIGLFADPLPPELAVDTPLMRNWHELLQAILDRDAPGFDRGLAARQELLTAHWNRGGGIAPLSLADLGGLALVRTARARGLTPAVLEAPYLALDLV